MDELVIFEGLFHDIDGDPITIDLIASYLRKTQLESNQSINILGEPFISNYSDDESKSESDSESDNENNVQEVDDGDDDVVEEVVEDNYDDGDNIDENPIPDNFDGSICKTDDDPLGIISNFGAFSFGDFIAYNSDVQGRIAAKNLVDVSSYAINQEVYGSKRYKCNESPLKNDFQFAVVAGTVKIVNSGLSNGGIAYSNNVDQTDESLKENIINNGCSIINDSSIVNFDAVEKQMNTLSQNISKLEDNGAGVYSQDGGNKILNVNIKKGQYIHIIDVDGPNFNLNTFKFNTSVKADEFLVIFNVKGSSMIFSNCEYGSMNGYAHRVIWNMPDVTSLNIGNVRVYGTILAPKAYVQTNYGNIQGQIICKNFNGPLQVDWIQFKACLPSFTPNHENEDNEDDKTNPEVYIDENDDDQPETNNDENDEYQPETYNDENNEDQPETDNDDDDDDKDQPETDNDDDDDTSTRN